MELTGHIENGVVVFDGGTPPPEGTQVTVVPKIEPVAFGGLRPEVPIVRTGAPGTVVLTNEMIAEIIYQDDIAYMKGMGDDPA